MVISNLKYIKFHKIDRKIDLSDLRSVGYFNIIENPVFVATHLFN